RAISKDPASGVVSILMADGSEFCFNLDVCYPTGVVLLADAVAVGAGGTAEFEFRVNPSNAFIDFDPSQGMVRLDLVNEALLSRGVADSYVTDPKNFRLEKIEAALTPSGDVKAGQYKATIRDLGVATDYSQGVAIVVNTTDGTGAPVQVSSAMMRVEWGAGSSIQSFTVNGSREAELLDGSLLMVRLPYGTDAGKCVPTFVTSAAGIYCDGVRLVSGESELDLSMPRDLTVRSRSGVQSTVRVAASYSDLPILYLSTPAAIESKEVWVEGSRLELLNTPGRGQDMDVSLSVKGRGNSTWNYPKKPYALKLDKKDAVLGMPRHKRWVLLANYIDPSKMRNALAFEVARQTESLAWTPRGTFVDLVVNGRMMGNYYLCEQIRVDPDRVDMSLINI
ncbi:MAG: CotH kinase family protein, partial [Muribaculaceae bacterium]|nr:CotH kinase family protein [Muribaculaceae bacterium]